MKKALLFIIAMALGQAAFAQHKMDIHGTMFDVEIDESTMTAAIRDHQYKVDEAKFPIKNQEKKFEGFRKGEPARTVVIPETFRTPDGKKYTITTIGRAAFAGYSNVEYIIIPSTVTAIEDYAFFRTSITSMEIPLSVQSIGNRAFGWCTKLKSLKIPKGVAVNYELYAESKGLDVQYYAANDLAGGGSAVAPKDKSSVVITSDVDVDLPTASKQNDDMFAVIIANETYKSVENVEYALNDGRTFERYCKQVLGIPADHVHTVENATLGQMVEQINWVSRIAKAYEGDAKIIVYYAGHGIPNEKDKSAYLLPVDVSGDNTAAAYSLNTLYATLGGLNAKNITLFIDACFSGSRRGEGMLTSARGVAIKAKAEDPLGNMVVFSAAQDDETAYPYTEKGHGLFTYFLLKKLKETKGAATYGELSDYLRKEVSRKAIVVNNKPQTPTVAFSREMNDRWRGIMLK